MKKLFFIALIFFSQLIEGQIIVDSSMNNQLPIPTKRINFDSINNVGSRENRSKSPYSPERVNKPMPKIGTRISGQLTKATGWLFNPQGQWVSGLNKIPSDVDDFNTYQFREITIQDNSYSLFIKKHDRIVTKQGITYYSFLFYVFNKNELDKLGNISDDTINLIKINVLYSEEIIMTTNEKYISDIQNEVARQIEAEEDTREGESIDDQVYLVFHIAPYKAKNIVQFQIYSYQEIGNDNNIIGGVSGALSVTEAPTESEGLYLTNDLFKHCYFETDYQTFNSFIRLSKPETK